MREDHSRTQSSNEERSTPTSYLDGFTAARYPKVIFLTFAMLGIITVGSANAGLFSEVGKVLGVGGDVKKGLSFVDGLLPGGGGLTDNIMGAPGKAVFSGAIGDWKNANEKLIDKFGTTNDKTVDKLIQGLSKVTADIDSSIYTLGDMLDVSVDNLDQSLQETVDKLDNSLSNQTGRLDTVFQKQTSTFFYLGRIFLSVFVLAGFVITLLYIARTYSERDTIVKFLKQKWVVLAMSTGIVGISVLATWTIPDPSGLLKVEEQYRSSYEHALGFEDFSRANFDAAQLTILRPDSHLYRGFEIKSKALRDLFYRPTVLLDNDSIEEILGRLSQANDYQNRDGDNSLDPDIASAMALVAAIKSNSPGELAVASLATHRAVGAFNGNNSGKESTGVTRLHRYVEKGLYQMQTTALPIEFIQFINPEESPLKERYQAFLSAKRNVINPEDVVTSSFSLSSVDQLGHTLERKLYVHDYYANLSAKYTTLLHATMLVATVQASQSDQQKANNISAQTTAFCELFTYANDWHMKNSSSNRIDIGFVSDYLSGPFTLPKRALALKPLTADSACRNIKNDQIAALGNAVDLWISPLITTMGPSRLKGISVLRKASEISQAGQDKAFEEYEKEYIAAGPILSTPSDFSQVKNPEYSAALKSVAASTAVLGLYDFSDGIQRPVPAVHVMRIKFKDESLGAEIWKDFYRAFLESSLGA